MERNVPQEIRGERERSKAREDEVVNERVESLQTVEQSQLLQVQVVVFAHLSLQELAAKVHHSAHLNNHRQCLFTLYFTFLNTFIFGIQTENEYLTTVQSCLYNLQFSYHDMFQ